MYYKLSHLIIAADSFSAAMPAAGRYDGQLSATAYIILSAVLLIIIAGLGWCFYRAVTASTNAPPQHHDEIGDEQADRKK